MNEKKQKVLAIVGFSIVMACLLIAIVSDIVIFAEAIIMFIAAIFASCFIFLVCLILMIISIIFIFGLFIIDSEGFWPLTTATNTYYEIIADSQLTSTQIGIFIGIRIALLLLCIAGLVLVIIASKKENKTDKPPLKPMRILTIIFAIFGILAAAGLLVITFSLL